MSESDPPEESPKDEPLEGPEGPRDPANEESDGPDGNSFFEQETHGSPFEIHYWEERTEARQLLRPDMPPVVLSEWQRHRGRFRVLVCRGDDDQVQAELWVARKIESPTSILRCHAQYDSFDIYAGDGPPLGSQADHEEGMYPVNDQADDLQSLASLLQWLPNTPEVAKAERSVVLFDAVGVGRRSLPALTMDELAEAEATLEGLDTELVLLWKRGAETGLPPDDDRMLFVDSIDVHLRMTIRGKWSDTPHETIDRIVQEIKTRLAEGVDLGPPSQWSDQVFEEFRNALDNVLESARDIDAIADPLIKRMQTYAQAGESPEFEKLKNKILDGDPVYNAAAFVATYPLTRKGTQFGTVLALSVQGYDELVTALIAGETRRIIDPNWEPIKDKDGNEIQPPKITRALDKDYSDDPDKIRREMGLVQPSSRVRGLTFSSYKLHQKIRRVLAQGRATTLHRLTMRLIQTGALWSGDETVRQFAAAAVRTHLQEVSNEEQVDILMSVLKWSSEHATNTPRLKLYHRDNASYRMGTIARLLVDLPADMRMETAAAFVRVLGERDRDWAGVAVLGDKIATVSGGDAFPWGRWFTRVISSGTAADRGLLLNWLLHSVKASEVMRRRYFEHFAPRIADDAVDERERELAVWVCITAMARTIRRLMSRDYDKVWRRRVTESSLINRHAIGTAQGSDGESSGDDTALIPSLLTSNEIVEFVTKRANSVNRHSSIDEFNKSCEILLEMIYEPSFWHLRPPPGAFASKAEERRYLKDLQAMQEGVRDEAINLMLQNIKENFEIEVSPELQDFLQSAQEKGYQSFRKQLTQLSDELDEQINLTAIQILMHGIAPRANLLQVRLAMEIYALLAGSGRDDAADAFAAQIIETCDADWVHNLRIGIANAKLEQDGFKDFARALLDRDERIWMRDDIEDRRRIWRSFHQEVTAGHRARQRKENNERREERRTRLQERRVARRDRKRREP